MMRGFFFGVGEFESSLAGFFRDFVSANVTGLNTRHCNAATIKVIERSADIILPKATKVGRFRMSVWHSRRDGRESK